MTERVVTLNTDKTMTDIIIVADEVVKVGEVGDAFNIQLDTKNNLTIYRFDQDATPVDFSDSFRISQCQGEALPTIKKGLYFAHNGRSDRDIVKITVEKAI